MKDSATVDDAVGTEFTDSDYDEGYPAGYEFHYWVRARSRIVAHRVSMLCQKGETLLDIGAGRGHYVRVLRAGGFDAYGCDLGDPRVHDDVRAFVFTKTDFVDLDADLRRRVTAVLLLDVIEHIERPDRFIASILAALPSVRWIVVTVPARQELWSNYDEHYRHYLRYDIAGLRRVAQASRLAIAYWSYFFHALYVPAWILKRLGRNRFTAFPAPKFHRLHDLVGRLFWLESRLLPKAVFGTSLICVCTPQDRSAAS